jgi:hypothetical protein
MMDIFISRPNWVEEPFRKGLEIFLTRLSDLGFKPRTLGATDYSTKAPLDGVIEIISQCKGAVILGYPQISINSGSIKGKALEEPILLSTEWNHIEAGLAYSRKLPLLVIHHIGINRGIFDRGALNSFLFSKDLTDPVWSNEEDITGAIRSWRDEVLGFKPTPSSQRHSIYDEISRSINIVWTIQAIGRKINDPRPAGSHRESAECRIEELTEFYVTIKILSTDQYITIPFGDIVLSKDDKRNRPMIQLRAK